MLWFKRLGSQHSFSSALSATHLTIFRPFSGCIGASHRCFSVRHILGVHLTPHIQEKCHDHSEFDFTNITCKEQTQMLVSCKWNTAKFRLLVVVTMGRAFPWCWRCQRSSIHGMGTTWLDLGTFSSQDCLLLSVSGKTELDSESTSNVLIISSFKKIF